MSVSSSQRRAAGSDGGFGGSGFGSRQPEAAAPERGTGTTTSGADVEGTLSGSPAAKAGLVQGDVITAVNGTTVDSADRI